MQQVYNKGQAPVASDRIATVVTRDRGRPRRPQNETPEEAIYQGLILTEPAAVLEEVASQVATEATPRVSTDVDHLRATCPWRAHVEARPPYEANMLNVLLSSYGQNLFALVVARLPDKAPGSDGLTNHVWKNLPKRLLDKVWEYFRLCIQERNIHPAVLELTTVLLYKGKGNPLWLENWRPIALAKQFTKCFPQSSLIRYLSI